MGDRGRKRPLFEQVKDLEEREKLHTILGAQLIQERNAIAAENAVLREALDALVDHHCSGVCVPGQVFDRPEWNHEATMQKVTEAYNGRT